VTSRKETKDERRGSPVILRRKKYETGGNERITKINASEREREREKRWRKKKT
jgi:hypothetical protein